MTIIDQNLNHVLERIRRATLSTQRIEPPQLLAVSKMQTAATIRTVYEAGQRAFGESYVQEAIDKQVELANCAIEWHFIGPIQANKTRAIAEHFSWAHSVSRIKIAQRLNKQRPLSLPPLNVCLQVNLDKEENKAGIALTELAALAKALQSLPRLHLRGLMAIPAPRKTLQAQQNSFQRLTNALLNLQKQLPQAPLDTLSMGMSADLEAAIAAGATIVRVGTAVFGQRNE